MKVYKYVQRVLGFGTPQTRTLFGVLHGTQLGRGDIILVEYLLSQMQGCRTVLEFGAGTGLQTVYWGISMALRQGDVYVFNSRRPPYYAFWPANVKLYLSDEPKVSEVIAECPTLVIIDGGDRLARITQCVETVSTDSVMVVHDWIPRRYPEFVEEASSLLLEKGWIRHEPEITAALQSRFAVWKRAVIDNSEEDQPGDWCDGETTDDEENQPGDWCDNVSEN